MALAKSKAGADDGAPAVADAASKLTSDYATIGKLSLGVSVAVLLIALLPTVSLPVPYSGRLVAPMQPEAVANQPSFPLSLPAGFANVQELEVRPLLGTESVLGVETVVGKPDSQDITLLDRHGIMQQTWWYGQVSTPRRIGLIGRPLGSAYDSANLSARLVVCDSSGGLMRYDPATGTTEVLSNALPDGTPLHFVNDVSISTIDGKIYFSSATDQPVAFRGADELTGLAMPRLAKLLDAEGGYYDTMTAAKMSLVHGKSAGRLLVYDPRTKQTAVLLDGLLFANGVSLSPEEDFVLVCETYGARVHRYWLKGAKAGTHDIFVDRLPGYPDGISPREGGGYWLALVNPPSVLSWLAWSRAFRAAIAHVLPLVEPLVKKWGCVAKLGADGSKQALYMDPTGQKVRSVTSVHQQGRRLYLGNLMGSGISFVELADGE